MGSNWRERVGDLHLGVWDRLTAHMSAGGPDPLPEDMQPWDAQQALLYVAQAKGFVVLSGMGTDRPRIRLTDQGESISEPLMSVIQGNLEWFPRAVSAVDGTAAMLEASQPAPAEKGAPSLPPSDALEPGRRPPEVAPPVPGPAPQRSSTRPAPPAPGPAPAPAAAPQAGWSPSAPLELNPEVVASGGQGHWPDRFRPPPPEPPPPVQPAPPQPGLPATQAPPLMRSAPALAPPEIRSEVPAGAAIGRRGPAEGPPRHEDDTDRHIWKLLMVHEAGRREGEEEQVILPDPGGGPGAIAWVPAGLPEIVDKLDIHMSRVRRFQSTDGKELLVAPIGAILTAMLEAATRRGVIGMEQTSQGMTICPMEGEEAAFDALASFSGGPARGDLPALTHLLDRLTTPS